MSKIATARSTKLLVILVLLGGVTWFVRDSLQPRIVYKAPPEQTSSEPAGSSSSLSTAAISSDASLPPRVLIEVPFAAQAPLGNWDMPYQEACEESSMILVHHYLEQLPMTPEIMDAEILKVVEYEGEELGYHADTNAEQMATVAQKYYGHSATVYYDITIDDIKRELAKGNPVIVPLAGRDLGNPYYSGEGPWYHVLVIIGYDTKNFITNDVGTRRGEQYKYRYDVLFDAIHDWTGQKEDIRNGRKAMVVLQK
ncbi:MAG TPA: C39 family peptidase [Candidatus Peribacteraceae bacterium]|nr:C39 family peptidase [Candidatus Peribacteraceae bacterium]